MKIRTRTIVLIFSSVAPMLLSFNTYAQNPVGLKQSQELRADSLRKVDQNLQLQQESKDNSRMENAKDARKESKAKAKQENRINRDANSASKQSKKAVKAERKAQRSRKNANEQARKASEAREKSDKN